VNGGPTISVFGVYLPCNNRYAVTHECYLECLNELQGLIENCENGPCIVMGDFNTQLPQTSPLSRQWYRARVFSQRSQVLYDFCLDNDLTVANFVFRQSVNYTFHRSNAHSYIDHILVSNNLLPSVMSCTIVDSGAVNPNPSDHFPLCLCLKLSKPDPCLYACVSSLLKPLFSLPTAWMGRPHCSVTVPRLAPRKAEHSSPDQPTSSLLSRERLQHHQYHLQRPMLCNA
jgi:hypothetical protein